MTLSKAHDLQPFAVTNMLDSLKPLHGLISVDGGWILRAVGRIAKISSDFSTIWEIQFADESPAMSLPMVLLDGVIFATTRSSSGTYGLWAIDAQSGNSYWSRAINWVGENTYGGIAAYGGRLFLHDASEGMIPEGRILNAETGKEVGKMPEWPTNPISKGIGTHNPAFVQVGKFIFSAVHGGMAYCADLSQEQPLFEPLSGIHFPILDARDPWLVIRAKRDDVFSFLRLRTDSLETSASIPYQEVKDKLGVLAELRICSADVFVAIAEKGLAGMSFSKPGMLWTYTPDAAPAQFAGGLVLGSTFLILENSSSGSNLLEFVWETGELLARTQVDEFHFGLRVFSMGDKVVADAIASYLILERGGKQASTPPIMENKTPQDVLDSAVELDETDKAYSDVITAFVKAKSAQEQNRGHKALARKFNQCFDKFVMAHPEASIVNIALTLSKLGVPYEQALADVVAMRGDGQ